MARGSSKRGEAKSKTPRKSRAKASTGKTGSAPRRRSTRNRNPLAKWVGVSLAAAVAILAALFSQGVLAQAKDPAFIKDYKPTMPGVLLRGGSRGANPLNEHQLQRLCQDGVGHAIYTYDTGFKQGPARTCIRKDGTQGRIEYSYYRFLDKKGIEASMRAIHNSIVNPSSGSVFVHCWNGWHASGEIAAMALKQFCDYTNEQAIEYWKANIGDKGNLPKYGRVLTRISNFQPDPQLKVGLKAQRAFCPSP